ncbi:MAG TPA: DUF72 domain-containing protein [Pelomicrobium sp.]|nr:DUF72 domain-containing protein [Pelomicrobium sp.]
MQLEMFAPPPEGIGPAAAADDFLELARRLPVGLRLGTSSWAFPGWAGIVYDRRAAESDLARKGLAAYGAHPLLRTVGVDRTFHAPVGADVYADYAGAVPEDFRFLVKAPADCTTPHWHERTGRPQGDNPRFLNAEWAARFFVEPCVQGLGIKAGPLVFQFPPLPRPWSREPQRFAAALSRFLGALPRGPLYAVELRNAELLTGDYAAALAGSGAVHCVGVHPRMPAVSTQRALAPHGALVARWNLHAGFQYEEAKARYAPFDRLVDEDPATRAELAQLAREALAAGEPAYLVANNKAEGSAPLTAFKLAAAIAG